MTNPSALKRPQRDAIPFPKPTKSSGLGYDVERIRIQFPILSTRQKSKPLVYLDNGATTQKPRAVIDATSRYYSEQNANIHRGVYALSLESTRAYESARATVTKFLNAADEKEIIFTRGTTDSINLVASSFGRWRVRDGDEIIISALEHHANIVPWQMLAMQSGATLKVIPINDAGELLMDEYRKLLSPRTKMVAVTHVSNALGTIVDVKTIARLAHDVGAAVLIDGAQWVAHGPTDVREINADFYIFSGHKLYGPTGIGVLYGKREMLEAMPPYQTGGDMVDTVSFEKTTFAGLPSKFEAGTPNISGAVGLAAAIDWLGEVGFVSSAVHEARLLDHATQRLNAIPGLRIVGTAAQKVSVLSFVFDDPPIATLDVATRLDREGIAVRTGHHCCMPLMSRLGIDGTCRAVFSIYNTLAEVDTLADALHRIRDDFAAKMRTRSLAAAHEPVETYAPSTGTSPREIADELIEAFELLGDPESRLKFVEELGEKLPAMPASLKVDANFVKGCMSTVHIASRAKPGRPGAIELIGDSNTTTVKGLIAIVLRLFSGQKAKEVTKFDMQKFLGSLGIEQLVTVQRRIGLEKVIERVRRDAARIAETQAV